MTKCQVNEDVKFTKDQFDEMASSCGKWTKWQLDKMALWQNGKLTKWPITNFEVWDNPTDLNIFATSIFSEISKAATFFEGSNNFHLLHFEIGNFSGEGLYYN